MNNFKEKTTTKEKKPFRMPWFVKLLLWFGACGILIGLGIFILKDYVYGTIYIEAGSYPVTVKVNKEGFVTGIYSKYPEGRATYAGEELKYETIDTAVSVIMTNMCDMGYISDEEPIALITVTSREDKYSEDALDELEIVYGDDLMFDAAYAASDVMDEYFDNGLVLDQLVTADALNKGFAARYGISLGKGELIQQILEEGPSTSAYAMANMSLKELLQVCVDNDIDPAEFIDVIGNYPESITGEGYDDEDDDEDYDEEDEEDLDEDMDDTLPDSEYWENYDNDLEDNEYDDEDLENEEEEEEEEDLEDEDDEEDDLTYPSSNSTASRGNTGRNSGSSGNTSYGYGDDDEEEEEEEEEEEPVDPDDVWDDNWGGDNTWTPDPDWKGDN